MFSPALSWISSPGTSTGRDEILESAARNGHDR
jgi:hypothetical protein